MTDYASAKACDTDKFAAFFHGMLEKGAYFAPSQFEAAFVSTAHTEQHIEKVIAYAHEVMEKLA